MNKNIPEVNLLLIFCNCTNIIQFTFKASLRGRYNIANPQIYNMVTTTRALHTPYCQLTM